MLSDFDTVCRFCLTKKENMVPLFGEKDNPCSSIIQRIENCVRLQVSENDGLPPSICLECSKKLDKVEEFKDQCERSDAVLREHLRNKEMINIKNENSCLWIKLETDQIREVNQDLVSKRKKKGDENLSDSETDNSLGEERSPEVLSVSLPLKLEREALVQPLVFASQKTKMELKKHQKSQNRRYRKEKNSRLKGNEDNEFEWTGSLSDDDGDQNNHTVEKDNRSKKCNDEMKRSRKKAISQHPYVCEFCGRAFSRSNHLAQHEMTHTRDKPFHCSYCSKSFWYKNSLIGHIKQTHTGDVNYTCDECGRGFFQRSEFNRHKPIHSAETPFKCSDCGMAFKLMKNLRRHQKVHTGLRTHTCQYCGKSFRMLQTLRVHLILHTGEKPFKCTYCGKGFTQSAPLKAHVRMHTGEKPYVCNFCGVAFPTGNALKAHTFKHTGIHPNSCKDCSIVFKRKRDLVEHCDQVHDGVVTEPVQVTPQLPQDSSPVEKSQAEEVSEEPPRTPTPPHDLSDEIDPLS